MLRHSDNTGGGFGGDSYPMETAEAIDSRQNLQRDFMMEPWAPPNEYKWAMTGIHLSVGDQDHDIHFAIMGHNDFDDPHAWGTVEVSHRWDNLWHVDGGNMSLGMIENRIKRYAKDQRWNKATITDKTGVPYEQFKVQASGVGVGEGDYPTGDWHHQDLHGDYSGADYYGISDFQDDEKPKGPMICSQCHEPFANYDLWRQHVEDTHLNPHKHPDQGPKVVFDIDQSEGTAPGQQQYNQGDRAFMHGHVQELQRHVAVEQPPIPGPVPFIYDIEGDSVILGNPGQRVSDIPGQFTPGGIVEGVYYPNGKLQYQTDTDMPYTVRHMVQLWQYKTGPSPDGKPGEWRLPIKTVEKIDNGKPYKIAATNVGHAVRKIALADDAVNNVMHAVGDQGNVYVVGGAVRDAVLGKVPKDIDLMVQGIPLDQLESLLGTLPGRVDLTGKAFGVLRYKSPDGSEVEIALPRREQAAVAKHEEELAQQMNLTPEQVRDMSPQQKKELIEYLGQRPQQGHKDFDVQHDPFMSVEDDLQRRDFTGNAMAVNLGTGELIDPYHGAADLKAGKLKTVAPTAFRDDPLRTVRALASVSRHGLEPDEITRAQMAEHASGLQALPSERIQQELDKIMGGENPERAMRVARDTGVLQHIFPELNPAIGFDQKNKHHRLPLDEHLFTVLRRTAEQSNDKDLRLAALLHDVGKPASVWYDDKSFGHYYRNENGEGGDHQTVGAGITRQAMQRLKYPTTRINRVTHLVQHHMFAPFDTLRSAKRRIFGYGGKPGVGPEHIQDLLTLRAADQEGKGTDEWENRVPVSVQRGLAQQVMDEGKPTGVSSLAINGNDLRGLGLTPGPQFSQILNALSDKVIDDPAINNRSDLLAMAQQMSGNQDIGPDVVSVPKSGHVANILDPIQKTLDPTVFDNAASDLPRLKAKHAHWVKHSIYKWLVDAGWPDPNGYLHLVLTGSLTTYQYADHSDFDVSLWVDVDHFPDYVRADLIKLMIEKTNNVLVPGTVHPLQVFVVDSNTFKMDDLYKPGLRSAWDIDDSVWIVPPERDRVHDVSAELPSYFQTAKLWLDKFILMTRYYPPMVKVLYGQLHRQRIKDQQSGGGDFSESNIAYKMLRNFPGMDAVIERETGLHLAAEGSERRSNATGESFLAGTLTYPEIGLYRPLYPGEPLPPVNFTVFAKMQLESSWSDVADKAKRLINQGSVEVVRNTPTHVLANVRGDHGNYNVEISRHDPASQVIEQWSCDCPWNQFAFQRTRKWKRLEGRVCSHALAAYWQSRSTPLDMEDQDQGYQTPAGQVPGQAPGQMQLAPGMGLQPGQTPPTPEEMAMQEQETPAEPPSTQTPGDMVQGPDIQIPGLPQRPDAAPPQKNQLQLWDVTMPPGTPVPPTNPVSIPGGRPPTPLNPMDQLGVPGMNTLSTFRRSSKTEFDHYSKDGIETWAQEQLARGQRPYVKMVGDNVMLEQRGGKIPVPGAMPIGMSPEGVPLYAVSQLGYDPITRRKMLADEVGAHGPGAPEDRGTYAQVTPGQKAEVVRVYPELKSMYVRVPLNYGPGIDARLHPHHLEGFVDYPDVAPHRGVQDPWRAPDRKLGWTEVSMAADPDFIKGWIADNGPYLYHGVREGHDPQQILREGITPGKREYPDYGDPHKMEDWEMEDWWHTPRPNHVYMAVDPRYAYGTNLMRIDLRKLNPANLNPDEDDLRDLGGVPGMGEAGWVYEKDPNHPTLGEQAEALDWGSNPEDTHNSLAGASGTIAHRGPIPPEAIEHVATRPNRDTGSHAPWQWNQQHAAGWTERFDKWVEVV